MLTTGQIELTRRCNFSCSFCYNGKTRSDPRTELTTREVARFGEEFVELGGIAVNLSGGEVTLRRDLPEIWSYLARLGIKLAWETNASQVSEPLATELKLHPPFQTRVSLYGYDEESYYLATGNRGSWATVQRGISRLFDAGLDVEFRVPATRINAHTLEKISEAAATFGGRLMIEPQLWPTQDGARVDELRCRPSDIPRSSRKEIEMAREKIIKWNKAASNASFCSMGLESVYLNPWGGLHYCQTLWGLEFDWRTSDLRTAWEEWYPVFRDRSTGECAGWYVFLESGGKCPSSTIYDNPELSPLRVPLPLSVRSHRTS